MMHEIIMAKSSVITARFCPASHVFNICLVYAVCDFVFPAKVAHQSRNRGRFLIDLRVAYEDCRRLPDVEFFLRSAESSPLI